MTVDGFFVAKFVHHDLGNLVAGTAPDIHHLVIALALSHQTIGVLGLDFLHFGLGSGDDLVFLGRNAHIVGAEGNAGTGSQCIAVLHQLVGEHHGLLETATTERLIDELGNFLFLQGLVDRLERKPLGQNA